jgi:signal transduction histidine kinase
MQEAELTTAAGKTERRRVEAVVQTLATTRSQGEGLAELAHDARNMVTALALYCDLLEEPGVLTPSFLHYGSELRLVVGASRRLVEKLVLMDTREATGGDISAPALVGRSRVSDAIDANRSPATRTFQRMDNEPIRSLRKELMANRSLLDALAGMSIAVSVEAQGGALPVKLTGEDLTRVLVNLVKNAAESMRTAGKIRITLCERQKDAGGVPRLLLTVEDTGPGIPEESLEKIFEPGFTTRADRASLPGKETPAWSTAHRGLGLSITRSIIEAAGGRIRAGKCDSGGALFEMDLPVLNS